ncbi:MAG: hypothetical protein E7618_04705 [Ruminococcaceae bacterium]|nr:hypothetical protein [Oscillospiraceae bacterium]
MNREDQSLRLDEKLAFTLRQLFGSYGYTRYRMSKFEEYELYVENKDFIASPGIITFTDTDGRLLALKPDVTLSIVKNLKRRSGTQKVYYHENVYRVSKRSGTYREIPQIGLEAIGDIGTYELSEVLFLALRCLEATEHPFRLDLSHMGILSDAVSRLSINEEVREELLLAIKRKNAAGIRDVLLRSSIEPSLSEALATAASLYGTPDSVLPTLRRLFSDPSQQRAIDELQALSEAITALGYGDRIGIDLSIVGDMTYYSGLMFRGYLDGIPDGILLGGCYDGIMQKMGRASRAVGFALSLDQLDLLQNETRTTDFEALLLYTDDIAPSVVLSAVTALNNQGMTVRAAKEIPDDLHVEQIYCLSRDGSLTPANKEGTPC